MRPRPPGLIVPFLALSALLFAATAEASLTRPTTPAIESSPLIPASPAPAPEPSEFPLFEGHELVPAAAESGSAESFHPLAAVSLLSKDGAEPPLVSADELSYPKTRYRVFGFLGTPLIGVERGVTLELHWGSGEFRAGLASGTVGWLSQDPLGDIDSPNLYGFVGMRPHEKTDPLGLVASASKSGVIVGIRPDGTHYRIDPWTDPVDALRILESDPDIHTAAGQEDLLGCAGIPVPYSSAARRGEAVIDSRQPNYRRFTHLPSTGNWFEAALIATTGLPPQTREQEVASSVVGMAAAAAPAVAGPIARAKGGVGQAIQPAAFPQAQQMVDPEGMLPSGPFFGPAEPRSPLGNDVYESFPDPDPSTYQNGLRPDTPVVDHLRARALRGHPTDPVNQHVKAWSENSRKGWHEGNYLREREQLIKGGLTPAQAEWVLEPYLRWIMTDIHATPVDPSKLDKLRSP